MDKVSFPFLSTTSRSRLDWDDLRYVLAVSRAGSASGAAKMLSITYSTMIRRIDAIEEKLHVRLFERLRNGYILTEAGVTLCEVARQCEPLVFAAERRIAGSETRLVGNLRISTASVLAQYLLPSAVTDFRQAHSNIQIEIQTASERVDLSKREVDLALRMSAQVPDYLVGRKLGEIRFRIYSWHTAPFLSQFGKTPRPLNVLLEALPWIAFEHNQYNRIYDRWFHTNVPLSSIAIRADHFPNTLALLRTGIGVTLLPEFVAYDMPGLIPLSYPIDELQTPLWLLTHPDLRNSARVRAFMEVVGEALKRLVTRIFHQNEEQIASN